MTNRKHLSLIFICLLATCAAAQPAAPAVSKIDPPNWWTQLTPELTLLLTGQNLSGAHVESATRGVDVLDSQASANGHYLFLHLKLAADLPPQKAAFRLHATSGSTTFDLPLLKREANPTHFEGFNRDDVIYLIMPDRFADGDASNDRPPHSNGKYDRDDPMAYHGGDLRGIRDHLSYLHDLGVTSLWLTPVWKNTDSDYHGYHVVDFYALDDPWDRCTIIRILSPTRTSSA